MPYNNAQRCYVCLTKANPQKIRYVLPNSTCSSFNTQKQKQKEADVLFGYWGHEMMSDCFGKNWTATVSGDPCDVELFTRVINSMPNDLWTQFPIIRGDALPVLERQCARLS